MVYVRGWDTKAHTHLHTQDTTKVSNLLTLQSWLLQKQTFNQKQRPLQCSLETSGLHQQPLSPYTDQHWSTSCLKCVLVSASRHNYMKRCLDVVPWTVVWRVPQLRSLITFFFPLSATALIGGVWAAARAPCGGLPSRDWLRWKSNRVLIPTRPCRHWGNVNIVAEHSLIIYSATENLSTSFIALLSIIHQPVRGIISHTGKHTTKHTTRHTGKHTTSHKYKKIV